MNPGDEDDEVDLDEAMSDVTPLRDGPARAPERRARPARRVEPEARPPVVFQLDDPEDPREGLAPGIDRAHLRRLRRGQLPLDVRIDLHGLTARAARSAVEAALAAAWNAGQRCLLVVHGRGAHSRGGTPVLRRNLPGWLAEAPEAHAVMAFSPAPPALGGAGATLVLLRRHR